MQNLRDQLLKTGLITKGQKQQVEQDKRRERKQLKKGQADETARAQQQAYEAKLEAQRAADRQRAAEQRELLEAKERLLRIQHIIDYWKLSEEPSGTRRCYFVTQNKSIKYLYVSEPVALQLSTGTLAIVEYPGEFEEPRYLLIEGDAAALVARIDPTYVRFHNTELDVDAK